VEASGLSHSRRSLPADAQGIGTHGPAIRFTVLPPDPRVVLRERLERAPEEHAQAVLAAYDLLQALHDRGILDVATSAMAASDELLEKVVDGSTRRRASAAKGCSRTQSA